LKSPNTRLSCKVLEYIDFLFDKALETRDTIKEPGRKGEYNRDKIRREEK
jgi:hypothetical protein